MLLYTPRAICTKFSIPDSKLMHPEYIQGAAKDIELYSSVSNGSGRNAPLNVKPQQWEVGYPGIYGSI